MDLCCWLQSPPTSKHDHIQRAYIKIPLPSSTILLPQTPPPPSGVRHVPGPRAGANDGEQRQRVRQDQGEPPQVPPLQANTSPPTGQILINFPVYTLLFYFVEVLFCIENKDPFFRTMSKLP